MADRSTAENSTDFKRRDYVRAGAMGYGRLYAPPLRSRALSGNGWERLGARFLPGLAGVHIAEARKSLYAPAPGRQSAPGARSSRQHESESSSCEAGRSRPGREDWGRRLFRCISDPGGIGRAPSRRNPTQSPFPSPRRPARQIDEIGDGAQMDVGRVVPSIIQRPGARHAPARQQRQPHPPMAEIGQRDAAWRPMRNRCSSTARGFSVA